MCIKFFLHVCPGSGGMFLTSVFAKILDLPINAQISALGDCHDFGNGVWEPFQAIGIEQEFDKSTNTLQFKHNPNKMLYLSHVVPAEFVESNPNIKFIQISASPDDYYDISFLQLKKAWPIHWTKEQYDKWVGPDYPPYSRNNIAESDLICQDLLNYCIIKQTSDWYQDSSHINYSYKIDFTTVMGLDNKNLIDEVAKITGKNSNENLQEFVTRYQKLNQELYFKHRRVQR